MTKGEGGKRKEKKRENEPLTFMEGGRRMRERENEETEEGVSGERRCVVTKGVSLKNECCYGVCHCMLKEWRRKVLGSHGR